jgi:hypothetical protein
MCRSLFMPPTVIILIVDMKHTICSFWWRRHARKSTEGGHCGKVTERSQAHLTSRTNSSHNSAIPGKSERTFPLFNRSHIDRQRGESHGGAGGPLKLLSLNMWVARVARREDEGADFISIQKCCHNERGSTETVTGTSTNNGDSKQYG